MQSTVALLVMVGVSWALVIPRDEEVKEEQVLTAMGARKVLNDVAFEAFKESGKLQILKNSMCDECVKTMTDLENFSGNLTTAILDDCFKLMCDFVPGGRHVKQECYDFFKDLSDDILQWIELGLTPEAICTTIKICPSS